MHIHYSRCVISIFQSFTSKVQSDHFSAVQMTSAWSSATHGQHTPCSSWLYPQLYPYKTRPDSYQIDTNGDIVRCRGNGRVGKKTNSAFLLSIICCYL